MRGITIIGSPDIKLIMEAILAESTSISQHMEDAPFEINSPRSKYFEMEIIKKEEYAVSEVKQGQSVKQHNLVQAMNKKKRY